MNTEKEVEKFKLEISEAISDVMKSRLVFEYNDSNLHKAIRDKLTPLINQFKEEVCEDRNEKIKKLEFMIENGLGWKDMKNDITYPHEI